MARAEKPKIHTMKALVKEKNRLKMEVAYKERELADRVRQVPAQLLYAGVGMVMPAIRRNARDAFVKGALTVVEELLTDPDKKEKETSHNTSEPETGTRSIFHTGIQVLSQVISRYLPSIKQ